MHKFLYILMVIQLSFSIAFADDTKTLIVDKANSKIAFIADAVFVDGKLGYTVEGIFSEYEGRAQISQTNFADSKIQFKVKIASIKTKAIKVENNLEGAMSSAMGGGIVNTLASMDSMRDSHLKSADYFDSANFPEASFRSISISPGKSSNEYVLKGKLTIHGISQTGEFDLKPIKQYQDAQNKKHTVFEAKTSFNRNDFGVGVTAGQVTLLGHTIKIKDDVTMNVSLDMVEVIP